jgi:hypothetical protein
MNSQKYGLAALTPIYGQVISSAPTWSGPFEAPPFPPPIQLPKQKSEGSFWAGLGSELLVGAGCAAFAPTMVGMLACPLLAQGARTAVSSWIN